MYRVCVFDSSGAPLKPIKEACATITGVQVVSEVYSWNALQEALTARGFDAVLVNLDPADDSECILVRRISEVSPDVGIIGVSTDASSEAIIAAMRGGCHQFVRWPIEPTDLTQALESIGKRRPDSERAKSNCIAVMGSSGGAGATTIACNLAIELAQLAHQSVAVVDLDLQLGDVACAFDCSPQFSIADACKTGIESDASVVARIAHKLPNNVSVVARPDRVGDCDEIAPAAIEKMLRMLGESYPFVVLDLPRFFSPLTLAGLEAADRVLVVTQLSVPFLRNATRIRNHLREAGANDSHIEFIINRSNANFERITINEASQHLGKPIFGNVPNDYRRVTAARDLGHPIMSNSPNSPARLAIQDIARKLVSAVQPADEAAASSGGILGFLRRKPKAKVGV